MHLEFNSSKCLKRQLPTPKLPPSHLIPGGAFAHRIFVLHGLSLCRKQLVLSASILILVWPRLRPRLPNPSPLWAPHFPSDVVTFIHWIPARTPYPHKSLNPMFSHCWPASFLGHRREEKPSLPNCGHRTCDNPWSQKCLGYNHPP